MQVKSIAEYSKRAFGNTFVLENSAILLTIIKLPFAIKNFVCLILSGRFTQVILYLTSYDRN